jgi:hypothetical protein
VLRPEGEAALPLVKSMRIDWKRLMLAVLVAILGFGLYLYIGMLRFGRRLETMDFPELREAGHQVVDKELPFVLALVRQGSVPSRRIDHTSIGDPAVESQLIEISREVHVYDSMHHRLPTSFADLDNLGFPSTSKDNLPKFKKECQIVVLSLDSDIVNCDGWTCPNASDLDALVGSFNPQTEKFYRDQGHVLLYVPPPTKGISVPSKWNE